jgi:hypothetical protein
VCQHRGRTPSPAAQSTASRRHRNKPVPPRALRRQAVTVPLVAAVVPQPENLHTATPSRALALARRCRSVTGVRHHGLETRSPPSAGVSFLHRSSILVTRAARCFQGNLHSKLKPLRLSSTSPSPPPLSLFRPPWSSTVGELLINMHVRALVSDLCVPLHAYICRLPFVQSLHN